MPHPLEAGTIRIFRPNGSTAGTGFLVSKRLAVTCAHVITSAKAKPGDVIRFKFHLGDLESQEAKVLEDGWSTENDVAILELIQKLPKWIRPIIMQSSRAMEGRSFEGLGYPKDGPVNARWPQGNIGGQVSIEKEYALPVLQIQGTEIDQGLSGSAIVDRTTRRVIGMISAYRDVSRPRSAPNMRFGYAIPIETIWKVYPELEKELPPLPKRSPLVEGIHLLPNGYDFRIQNFLSEYLGSPEQPEPFGGREDALKALDDWLDGDTQRLVLAAPAGRGKSALLVRWLDRLIAREDLALVFVPVSVRFRTNLASTFFASLAARLAHLHGEDVPTSEMTSTDVWRGLVNAYLTKPLTDDRKFLVVLDGLDEAGDWDATADLIPSELPKNVCVVVSARFLAGDADVKPWLLRLGWERTGRASSLELPPLDSYGVADVLLHTGIPLDVLSRRLDIVTELHRLSEGDPLLVNLYVEDLWSRGELASRLQPEDLRSIKPGYEGYFARWWSDQKKLWGKEAPLRENSVRMVFNFLCSAIGGLTKDDLVVLDVANELNSYAIEEALNSLKRFVIGIPDECREKEVGYVFTHPKLRDYFWDRLTREEQIELENCYVAWGERIFQEFINGKRNPKDKENIPAYIIQYYGAHLERFQVPIKNFLPFVDYPYWHQAWFTYEGSYSGYLQDLDRVWRHCKIADRLNINQGKKAYFLAKQIRCALIKSSIHSLAKNIIPELLSLLVEYKVWNIQQALVYISQIISPIQQAQSIINILPLLTERDFARVIAATNEIQDSFFGRAQALEAMVQNAPDIYLMDLYNTALQIREERDLSRILSKISARLPNSQLGDLITIAHKIEDEVARVDLLCGIGRRIPLALEEALSTARNINNDNRRARALSYVAKLKPEIANETIDAARKKDMFEDEYSYLSRLSSYFEFMNDDQLRGVLKSADWIIDLEDRLAILESISAKLPEAVSDVLDIAPLIDDELLGARYLCSLIKSLPISRLNEAWLASLKFQNEYPQAIALGEIAKRLPKDRLPELYSIAIQMKDLIARAELLSSLAIRLPDLSHEAFTITREVKNKEIKVNILCKLARQFPEIIDEALMEASKIADIEAYAHLMSHLAKYAPEASKETLNSTWELPEDNSLVRILIRWITYLPEVQLPEFLSVVRSIKSEWIQAKIITKFALKFPQVFDSCLEFARNIVSEEYRTEVLNALVECHPDELALNNLIIMVKELASEERRYNFLISGAKYLEEIQLPILLGLTRTVSAESLRSKIIISLAQRFPKTEFNILISEARQIANLSIRSEVFICLAQFQPELISETLMIISHIKEDVHKRWMIRMFGKQYPNSNHQKVLEIVGLINDEYYRAEVITKLDKSFPELYPMELLAMAPHFKNERRRSDILNEMVGHFQLEHLSKTLDLAMQISGLEERASVLCNLAQYLPSVLEEALSTARQINDPGRRASTLCDLVGVMPNIAQEILVATHQVHDEWTHDRLLYVFIEKIKNTDPQKAYSTVESMIDNEVRADTLNMILKDLPDHELSPFLSEVRKIRHEDYRARVLINLLKRMPDIAKEILTIINHKYINKSFRFQLIRAVIPFLPPVKIKEAVDIVVNDYIDENDVDAFCELIQLLPKSILLTIPVFSDALHIYGNAHAKVIKCISKGFIGDLENGYEWIQLFINSESHLNRSEFFTNLSFVLPLIIDTADTLSAREIYSIFQDVNTWWP